MKNFEMPKMNISIFSEENIVTESNMDKAKAELESNGVAAENITVTTFNSWSTL